MKCIVISIYLMGLSLLSGCLASIDLKNDQSLSSGDRRVAARIAELTQQLCVRYTYEQGTDRKLSGNMKLSESPAVKRMYRSDSGWVKAEVLANGVWDNSYYLESSGKFICGENSWQKFSDSTSIIFREIGK